MVESMNMEYKNLKITREGFVTIVTFNRPEKLNTLSLSLMNEIKAVSESFNGDSETRVVIFTGAGKNFSCGFDLNDAGRADQKDDTLLMKYRNMKLGPQMIRCITEIDQITIAAVNGLALGGGACITTACDFRIGADNCKIGYPEVNLAMNLSWVSLPLCVHLIGPARAKRMVILAKKETAITLLDWGFLDELAPMDALLDQAREMAKEYAAQPPLAAQMVKRSVNALVTIHDQAIMHMDSDQLLYATSGEDFSEAIHALLEKREGNYKGN